MDSIEESLILFLTKVNMSSSAFLVPRHEICSMTFVHDVIPYIRTPNFKGKMERLFLSIVL